MTTFRPTIPARLVLAAVLLLSCGDPKGPDALILGPCDECYPGAGAMSINLPLQGSDLEMVTATVRRSDNVLVATQSFGVVGADVFGQITNILQGNGYKVHLDGFPIQTGPDAAVVIWKGDDNAVNVVGGMTVGVNLRMFPVTGTVNVTVHCLPGTVGVKCKHDLDRLKVWPLGDRYVVSPKFGLTATDNKLRTWLGTADNVFVGNKLSFRAEGINRFNVVTCYAFVNNIVVTEAGPNTVDMTLEDYLPNMGTIDIGNTGVCVPNCGVRKCGPDPTCGLSCGSCKPGHACNAAGVCI